MLRRRRVLRRFHRPREGSHGKQILAVGLRTKALPPNPAASCQPARPEDRNAVLCSLPSLPGEFSKSKGCGFCDFKLVLSQSSEALQQQCSPPIILLPEKTGVKGRNALHLTGHCSPTLLLPLGSLPHHSRRSPRRPQGRWGDLI